MALSKSISISITAKSEIELLEREAAFRVIAELTTKELKNLASMAKSENARKYLTNAVKFQTLKAFL